MPNANMVGITSTVPENALLVIEAPQALKGKGAGRASCTFPNHKLKTLKGFRVFLG
jgi:hypothetical protein